jgi:ATP-dependent RNA helicase HrpA
MTEFRAAPLAIDFESIVPAADRERLLALPDTVVIRGREVPIDYDVEDGDGRPRGVARLRLPEKLARTLTEDELPMLDRPIRFTVLRGPRGAVRATTLDELQDTLARPWSPDEVAVDDRPADLTPREERRTRELAREIRRNQRGRGERYGSRDNDRDRGRRRGGNGRGPRPPGKGPGHRRRGR